MSVADEPRLFVVIPVFNGWDQTRQCLLALQRTEGARFQIMVVDHGSSDQTKTALATDFPEVEVVSGPDSLWWTGATNLGIRSAIARGATAIMLLNNDSYVEARTIQRLLAHHTKLPDAIIAGGQLTLSGQDLEVQRFSSCLLLGMTTLRRPRFLSRRLDSSGLWRVRLIIGGRGVIIPVATLEKVGPFDEERLPHYGADHDFYWRCGDAGVALYVAPDAWVLIDDTRTSIANTSAHPQVANLKRLLSDRRSHRNFAAQKAMLQRHYPIKSLYWIGLSLFLLRYLILTLCSPSSFAKPSSDR